MKKYTERKKWENSLPSIHNIQSTAIGEIMALRRTGHLPGTFPVCSTSWLQTAHSISLGRAREAKGWGGLVRTTSNAWVKRQSPLSAYSKAWPNATLPSNAWPKALPSLQALPQLQPFISYSNSHQKSCQYFIPVYHRQSLAFLQCKPHRRELPTSLGVDVREM